MQLIAAKPREGTPRGEGYPEVMKDIAGQKAALDARLDGMMPQARQLAATADPKEAARLIVEILQGLPRRPPRP